MFSQASDENGGTPVESAYAVRLLYHIFNDFAIMRCCLNSLALIRHILKLVRRVERLSLRRPLHCICFVQMVNKEPRFTAALLTEIRLRLCLMYPVIWSGCVRLCVKGVISDRAGKRYISLRQTAHIKLCLPMLQANRVSMYRRLFLMNCGCKKTENSLI